MLATSQSLPPTSRLPAGETLPRWLGRLAWLLVLAGGVWLLGAIGWQFLLPPPSPPLPAPGAPAEVAREVAARQLLGRVAATAEAGVEGNRGDSGFRLLGVMAADGRSPGIAVLQASGEAKPKVVAENGEVAAGVRLLRVESRQVVLSQNGREVAIKLPEAGRPQPSVQTSPSRPN